MLPVRAQAAAARAPSITWLNARADRLPDFPSYCLVSQCPAACMAYDHQNKDSCLDHGRLHAVDRPEPAECAVRDATIAVRWPRQPTASVAILLCTRNGQAHLVEQLESIARQHWPAWFVALSDDGSTDRTLEIARHYRDLWGGQRLSLWQGPQRGFAQNFLSCVRNPALSAEFYAWCDQDDVWHEDKLTQAVCWLQSIPAQRPALYMGRTRLIDAQGRPIGLSPRFRRRPGFANALVQNIGGGNTMVFNHAARCLLSEFGTQLERSSLEVVSHDWWAYLVVTGVGGQVLYDPRPYVNYRQHDANLVGANTGWKARWLRLRLLLQGRLRDWNSTHLCALEAVQGHLTEENRQLLRQFRQLRGAPLGRRLAGLWRARLYRQTLVGGLGLWLAAVVGVL